MAKESSVGSLAGGRRFDIMNRYQRNLDFKTPFVDDIEAPQTNDAWVPILPDPDPEQP